ncbi:hypothetical protein OOZ51_21115 [Arthrobacter sp. MI7-26]|uniref:hypothetical protein n=1 Tax=Arthrobacter sp. MI7-26 TaxID=2993653 RepID=UPI00224932A9|nr:hypothetical protein [Arthrobacter sp. MI7-26]MCX2750284.1 hypothetical protein [Arthrobacter sp. MI7-26]
MLSPASNRDPVVMAKLAHLGIHSHAGSSCSAEEAISKSARNAIDVQLGGSGIHGDLEVENFRTDADNNMAKDQSVALSRGTANFTAKAECFFTLTGTLPKG